MVAPASKIPESSKSKVSPTIGSLRGQEGLQPVSAGKNTSNTAGTGKTYDADNTSKTSSTSPKSRDNDNTSTTDGSSYDPKSLKDSEEAGGDNDSEPSDGGLWSGDNESTSSTGRKSRFKITRKKAAAGATGLFILGATGFGTLSITQGPMQLIHAAEILQKPLTSQNDNSESRMQGLLRFAKTGDVGETRLSWYGSRKAKATIAKLKDIGFTVESVQPGSERPTSFHVDASKFDPGATTEEAALKFAEARGIPHDYVVIDVKSGHVGGVFRIQNPNGGPIPDNISTDIQKTAISKLFEGKRLGKLLTAVKARPVLRFNGNYNKLHPWEILKVRTQEAAAAFEQARQEKKAERSAIAEERAAKIKSKLKPASGVIGVVSTASLGVCVAKDIAHEVPLVNYENVKMPSANAALDVISEGEAIKSNALGDFDIRQIGESTKRLYDKDGKSIWQGKALNALAYNSAGSGADLDSDVKNSYSNQSTAANIENSINSSGGSAICSTAGQLGLGALGLVALVAAAPTGGASAAAYTAVVIGTTAGTMAVVAAVTSIVPKLVGDKPLMATEKYLAGPQNGNIMAYGSELFAGDTARKSGGVELSEANTAIIDKKLQEEDQKDFQSKSTVSRLFDLHDYRSLAARTIDSADSSSPQNVARLSLSSLNLSSIYSKLFGSSFAKVSADSGTYKFGFPKYGFSEADMNNPLVENPYVNAEEAAKILKNDPSVIDRAEKCFGVILSEGDNGWQVDLVNNPEGDPTKDVITTTADYQDADCADKSDNWLRIRMFIFDSRTMEAYTCVEENDNDACLKAGIDGSDSGSTDTTDTSTDATITKGSQKELAQKLLKYKDEGKYDCKNPEDCDDLTLMAAGKSISCASKSCKTWQACKVEALDKRVLQTIIYLIDKNYKIKTFAFCRAHRDSGGVHDDGLAVDISDINSETLGSGASPKAKTLALEVDKILFNLKGDLAVKQLITGGVGGTRVIDPDFVKYNREAPGVEGSKARAIPAFESTMEGHTDHIHVGF